jgi:hypothetical protein
MWKNPLFLRFLFIVFGILLVTSALPAEPLLFVLLSILYIASRQRDAPGRDRQVIIRGHDGDVYDDTYYTERPVRQERTKTAEQIHSHALKAVRSAQQNPDTLSVLPTDIGLITFIHDVAPGVYRTQDVPDDLDYVQPFVELRVPVDARGKVRFEIIDATGKPVFIHEDYHDLRRGRNLVSPGARLPVHDELEIGSAWQIRVYADGILLATHLFYWYTPMEGIRQHIGEDGEISSELRAIVAESRLQPLSLDDLLAEQEAEQQRQAR